MRPHEEHAKYEPLEQAAQDTAQFLTDFVLHEPDTIQGDRARFLRDALLAALVRTGYAEREAQNKVLRERLARAHHPANFQGD
jgi:hypothetical protein